MKWPIGIDELACPRFTAMARLAAQANFEETCD
jgi:hypothetical protein